VIGMDYWKRYGVCGMCDAAAGERCRIIRGGVPTEMTRARAHPGRPVLPAADR
jgi:hypothetical protein